MPLTDFDAATGTFEAPDSSEAATTETLDDCRERCAERAVRAVEDWFRANIPGSPAARSTEAYNPITIRLDDLKTRIVRAIRED